MKIGFDRIVLNLDSPTFMIKRYRLNISFAGLDKHAGDIDFVIEGENRFLVSVEIDRDKCRGIPAPAIAPVQSRVGIIKTDHVSVEHVLGRNYLPGLPFTLGERAVNHAAVFDHLHCITYFQVIVGDDINEAIVLKY
jgi:hypothetical protein